MPRVVPYAKLVLSLWSAAPSESPESNLGVQLGGVWGTVFVAELQWRVQPSVLSESKQDSRPRAIRRSFEESPFAKVQRDSGGSPRCRWHSTKRLNSLVEAPFWAATRD